MTIREVQQKWPLKRAHLISKNKQYLFCFSEDAPKSTVESFVSNPGLFGIHGVVIQAQGSHFRIFELTPVSTPKWLEEGRRATSPTDSLKLEGEVL